MTGEKRMSNQNKKNAPTPTVFLTFFERGFYSEIDALELAKKEKANFFRDMVSLTPKERKNLLVKMKESINTPH